MSPVMQAAPPELPPSPSRPPPRPPKPSFSSMPEATPTKLAQISSPALQESASDTVRPIPAPSLGSPFDALPEDEPPVVMHSKEIVRSASVLSAVAPEASHLFSDSPVIEQASTSQPAARRIEPTSPSAPVAIQEKAPTRRSSASMDDAAVIQARTSMLSSWKLSTSEMNLSAVGKPTIRESESELKPVGGIALSDVDPTKPRTPVLVRIGRSPAVSPIAVRFLSPQLFAFGYRIFHSRIHKLRLSPASPTLHGFVSLFGVILSIFHPTYFASGHHAHQNHRCATSIRSLC